MFFTLSLGYDGMARLLISRGTCVDISSSKGIPLHVAASYGGSGVLQILLEHHAGVIINMMLLLAFVLLNSREGLDT